MDNIREIFIPNGSDQDFEIDVADINGASIDLSDGYTNAVVIIYNANRSVLDKFSILSAAGWKSIDPAGLPFGKLSFRLITDTTNLAYEGKKYVEVRLQKTDTSLADGLYDMIITGKYLCTITKSISSTLTLP